jgi:hypothetical protein
MKREQRSSVMAQLRRNDPRDTADGWDAGWENALDEGEGVEEVLLQVGDAEFRSERGYYVRNFDQPLLGKNESDDPYLA